MDVIIRAQIVHCAMRGFVTIKSHRLKARMMHPKTNQILYAEPFPSVKAPTVGM